MTELFSLACSVLPILLIIIVLVQAWNAFARTGRAGWLSAVPGVNQFLSALRGNRQVSSRLNFYGGRYTDPNYHESTRLMAARAVLDASNFREKLYRYYQSKHRATAPEVGLDIQLVAQVARSLELRENRYRLIYIGLFLASLLLCGICNTASYLLRIISRGDIRLDSFAAIAAFLLFILLWAGIWITYVVKTSEEWFKLAEWFKRGKFDLQTVREQFKAVLSDDLLDVLPDDRQNAFVYSGFTPFIGTGADQGGWSFAINLERGKEDIGHKVKIMPFAIPELYSALEKGVKHLNLEGVIFRDGLFINGADLQDNPDILADPTSRPVQVVPPKLLDQYISQNNTAARYYKWIRIHDWGSELVFSTFIRCVQRGSTLFVEFRRRLLTPLDYSFREIDRLPPRSIWGFAMVIIKGAFVSPLRMLNAIMETSTILNEYVRHVLNILDNSEKEAIKNLQFDYGVANSFRESLSPDLYTHYFQMIDSDMYAKIVERQILDTIVAFLDEHGIDTSDIKERRTTIMNSGTIINATVEGNVSGTVAVAGQSVSTGGGASKSG
jgi:hypothetical protein